MRTTVDLDDKLLIAAKKRAAELQKPLRFLIEMGLRTQLNFKPEQRSKKGKSKTKIRWVTVEGGLPVDISSREKMHDWMREKK